MKHTSSRVAILISDGGGHRELDGVSTTVWLNLTDTRLFAVPVRGS